MRPGGTGRTADRLRAWSGSVFVLDRSLPMLSQAAGKGIEAAVAGKLQALPFRSACFQRVVLVDSLHHSSDPIGSLAQLWRCLEPGGKTVIEEPNIERPVVKLIALAERLASAANSAQPTGSVSC
ncbi:MAG: class I SAM-dependent methyltransferase [Anaerolineales bacterium]